LTWSHLGENMKNTLSSASCCLIIAVAVVGIAPIPWIVAAQGAMIAVNIGINYGNETIEWHNNTVVPSGENLLNATMRVAIVEFKSFPGLGAFVTSINGRGQNPSTDLYWTYWVYNPQTRQYELGPVGAGSYLLTSNQTVQWLLSNVGCYPACTLGPNQGVKRSSASAGTSGGVPGFPTESLLVGSILGLLFLISRRKKKFFFAN